MSTSSHDLVRASRAAMASTDHLRAEVVVIEASSRRRIAASRALLRRSGVRIAEAAGD